MPRALDVCPACQHQAVLRQTTLDCACRVCEDCANQFLSAGRCGLCQTTFTDDDPEPEEQADDFPYRTDY